MRKIFTNDCIRFPITKLSATLWNEEETVIPLPARATSMLMFFLRQLCSGSIRDVMSFRRVLDTEKYGASKAEPFIIADIMVLGKVCTDGYAMKGGRNMEMATITNLSIEGAGQSTDATDILLLADMKEDRFTRGVISQYHEVEEMLLGAFGLPGLRSGENIRVATTKTEDSKSMQMAMGRGGPMSESRLLWGKEGYRKLYMEWQSCFVPMSFAAGGAHERWDD